MSMDGRNPENAGAHRGDVHGRPFSHVPMLQGICTSCAADKIPKMQDNFRDEGAPYFRANKIKSRNPNWAGVHC